MHPESRDLRKVRLTPFGEVSKGFFKKTPSGATFSHLCSVPVFVLTAIVWTHSEDSTGDQGYMIMPAPSISSYASNVALIGACAGSHLYLLPGMCTTSMYDGTWAPWWLRRRGE